MAQRAAGDHEAVGVDRVARVRHQHDVAGSGDRHREVGEPLLGAEGGDHLGLGVELHPEAAGVVAGLGAAQAGDALRRRIAVGARALHRLDQLVDDVAGRVHVGVAHAEVDDVHALGAVLRLQPVDLGEDVGRQALDAVELFGHRRGSGRAARGLRYTTGGRGRTEECAGAIRGLRAHAIPGNILILTGSMTINPWRSVEVELPGQSASRSSRRAMSARARAMSCFRRASWASAVAA